VRVAFCERLQGDLAQTVGMVISSDIWFPTCGGRSPRTAPALLPLGCGITPLLEALRRHCQAGRGLRILTTTYTGSTEARALRALADLGAEVRVSYETSSTRLHAKAWLFQRESGFSTAYVGSSNLTHSAQVSGLEWNVRVSSARNLDVIEKIAAVFESYWNGGDFRPFDEEQFTRHVAAAVA
jgi:HKD family nuclease